MSHQTRPGKLWPMTTLSSVFNQKLISKVSFLDKGMNSVYIQLEDLAGTYHGHTRDYSISQIVYILIQFCNPRTLPNLQSMLQWMFATNFFSKWYLKGLRGHFFRVYFWLIFTTSTKEHQHYKILSSQFSMLPLPRACTYHAYRIATIGLNRQIVLWLTDVSLFQIFTLPCGCATESILPVPRPVVPWLLGLFPGGHFDPTDRATPTSRNARSLSMHNLATCPTEAY